MRGKPGACFAAVASKPPFGKHAFAQPRPATAVLTSLLRRVLNRMQPAIAAILATPRANPPVRPAHDRRTPLRTRNLHGHRPTLRELGLFRSRAPTDAATRRDHGRRFRVERNRMTHTNSDDADDREEDPSTDRGRRCNQRKSCADAHAPNAPATTPPATNAHSLGEGYGHSKPSDEKSCSWRRSPPTPARPGTTTTGLSRRRSRVRVPSLP